MASENHPKLTVELEETGDVVDSRQIVAFELNTSFFTPTDSWSFTVITDDDEPWRLRDRFRPLQPVKLYIDGRQQVLGRIDRIKGVHGSSALQVFGRDYLADIVDGSVDPTYRVNSGMDMADAVLGALKPWGITTVFGTNNTRNILTGRQPYAGPPPKDFQQATLEDFKTGDDDGAFEWCNKVVARHGFTLQPAGTRDSILIIQPNYEQDPLYTLSRPGTVIDGSADRDYSDVPTVTLARGRGTAADGSKRGLRSELPTFGAGSFWSQANNNQEIRSIITGANGQPAIRSKRFDPDSDSGGNFAHAAPLYRPMFYSDKDSRNQEQLESGVRRKVSAQLMKTLAYECTVRGVTDLDTGATYAVDTIAQVVDQIEYVNERMWVAERTFSFSEGSDALTTLKLIRLGSYVL